MAIGVEALPLTFVAHALAVAGAVMVLVWNLYYRGGLAWEATNKSLIFNVSLSLMLSSFYFGFMDSFLGVFFCVCVFILVFRSFFLFELINYVCVYHQNLRFSCSIVSFLILLFRSFFV